MKTVCIVWMGYQNIKSYLGVFENKTKAWHFLMDRGCVQVEGTDFLGRIYREVRPTKEFLNWLSGKVKDCPFIYSVAEELPPINFDTARLDTIMRGYDDD